MAKSKRKPVRVKTRKGKSSTRVGKSGSSVRAKRVPARKVTGFVGTNRKRSKNTSKRKSAARAEKSKTIRKTFATRTERTVRISRSERRLRRSVSISKANVRDLRRSYLKKLIGDDLERKYKQTRNREKKAFTLRIPIGLKIKGKRFTGRITLSRTRLTKIEHADRYIREAIREFQKRLRHYILSKGITAVSLRGIEVEVSEVVSPKTHKKAKARKK